MKDITILDLILAEQVRMEKLWEVRNSQPRRESLDQFIKNYKLQEENRQDFNEIYNRYI